MLRSIGSVLLAALGGTALLAQEATSPFAQATLAAPAVRSALLRAEGASEAAKASGLLPDPQVEFMAGRSSMPGDSHLGFGVAVVQALPRKGELAATRNFTAAQAVGARAEAQRMVGEVAYEAASFLAERENALARSRLAASVAARFEAALPAFAARIASGDQELGGWATLRARLEALRLEAATFEAAAESLADSLRALLALEADAPLPAFDAPQAASGGESTSAALAHSRASEARAEIAMRRAAARPMSAVRLSYERDFIDGGDEDRIELSFMMDLPFRARRSASQLVRAAGAAEAAALDDARLAQARLKADTSRALRAKSLADRTRATTASTVPLIETEIASLLARSATGMQDAMPVASRLADLARDLAELQALSLDAERDAQLASAALWLHLPPTLPAPSTSR